MERTTAPLRSEDLLSRFANLAVWKRGAERAPNKPLTVLKALGLFSQGVRSLVYSEKERELTELLTEFGPARRSVHPEYPFWRLQNDDVWVVESAFAMEARASNSGDVPKSQLRAANARGHFPEDIEDAFVRKPQLISEVAQLLLEAHFPESLHRDILDAVGLPTELPSPNRLRRKRDPAFRKAVLLAYQYRCAVCGFDMRIGNVTIGLEAAHIKWHQAYGPDDVDNGIAMCTLHHKLFDLGAFTLGLDNELLVSEQVHGTGELDYVLLRHHEGHLHAPNRIEQRPAREFVSWHRKEVFKSPGRPLREDRRLPQ